jgi:hypothetical protein
VRDNLPRSRAVLQGTAVEPGGEQAAFGDVGGEGQGTGVGVGGLVVVTEDRQKLGARRRRPGIDRGTTRSSQFAGSVDVR